MPRPLFPGSDLPSHDLEEWELPRSLSLFPKLSICLMACSLSPPSGGPKALKLKCSETESVINKVAPITYPSESVPLCKVGIIELPHGALRGKE